tara:strand:+ start:4510 stop:5049 length:540 start_codon:yes stop_codon:yes gene_type:complete
MKKTIENITAAGLAHQVRLDFQTERDTSTIVVGRYNALVDAGSEDPAAEVMKELLETTSKLTRNKKPSWSKIAAYAFLGGWSWDAFNTAMKGALKLWQPKWDAKKRSSMMGCWGTYKYDADLWAVPKGASTKRAVTVDKVKRQAEALLESLDALKSGVKKGKEWTDAKALLRAIGREGK